MSKKVVSKIDDFHVKVTKGLKLSFERMIQTKIEKNQSVVIMRDGKIITIKASELHKL
ncbi:hypothetical protein [Flavobacterium sp.]|jgi:hypothetical protein|uniref:hypothetical protein n=1 Tax=Flavobacterium sp. TaxID=239 RepID=UPI0037501D2C